MNLHHFFGASSSSSKSTTTATTCPSEEEDSDIESLGPNPPKKQCSASGHASSISQRKYNEKSYPWLEYDDNHQGAFCKICRKSELLTLDKTGGIWTTKPFKNWKKALEKMKKHANSEAHNRNLQAEIFAARARKDGSVVQQLQRIGEQEKIRNRKAIKAFLRCTHFLARQHIPHTTNYDKLVDLVVSCGGQDLVVFVTRAGRNATYTSTDAVTDFVEAIGIWVDEFQTKRLLNARFYSIMADECTDVATIEELSIFCRCVEDGEPVEHFLEILPLQKANA